WIFIDGNGAGLLNFTPGPIMSPVLVLIMAIIYGLSTDYEVFLLSRMVEARAQGASTTEAVRVGTAHTGRIISAAALILIVVTGAFAFSELVMMKYIAYGMIAALVIDATLIRMFLVPATMKLLGDDCWWAPAWMKRIQEKLGLGEPILEDELMPSDVPVIVTPPMPVPVEPRPSNPVPLTRAAVEQVLPARTAAATAVAETAEPVSEPMTVPIPRAHPPAVDPERAPRRAPAPRPSGGAAPNQVQAERDSRPIESWLADLKVPRPPQAAPPQAAPPQTNGSNESAGPAEDQPRHRHSAGSPTVSVSELLARHQED
ncbi:MMPL family transporter, partial [Rhodococcus sp. UNC363MFTsu5.1]|uniref:MMPL family transporter n=1 Tax=Rhodococcus sp. UNC363MFTsu5.1 TaxID=1449069 RepID=UPI0004829770